MVTKTKKTKKRESAKKSEIRPPSRRAGASRREYRILNHTADIGLSVQAPTLAKLFENTAKAFTALMVSADKFRERQDISVAIRSHDTEALLVRYLQEINYIFQTQKFITADVSISEITEKNINATLKGELFNSQRHTILREIKAVTFHNLKVQQTKKGWKATVIFDI